jgi:hypothetical protein
MRERATTLNTRNPPTEPGRIGYIKAMVPCKLDNALVAKYPPKKRGEHPAAMAVKHPPTKNRTAKYPPRSNPPMGKHPLGKKRRHPL